MTSEGSAFSCQRGASAGGRCAVSASKFAVMSERDACLCQKNTFTGGRGARSALKGTDMGEKALFCARRALHLREGAAST